MPVSLFCLECCAICLALGARPDLLFLDLSDPAIHPQPVIYRSPVTPTCYLLTSPGYGFLAAEYFCLGCSVIFPCYLKIPGFSSSSKWKMVSVNLYLFVVVKFCCLCVRCPSIFAQPLSFIISPPSFSN